jgi:Dna[CI] antecedent, DciA
LSGLPERIGSEVQRELRRFGPAGAMGEIVKAWPGAVGEVIARNAWPARVGRDGTLYVATSSSTWAYELGLLEKEIHQRLAAVLDDDAPARLRFAPGRLPETPREAVDEHRKATREPTSAERREAGRLAARIQDENLRKVVAEAAAAGLAQGADGHRI